VSAIVPVSASVNGKGLGLAGSLSFLLKTLSLSLPLSLPLSPSMQDVGAQQPREGAAPVQQLQQGQPTQAAAAGVPHWSAAAAACARPEQRQPEVKVRA